MSTAPVPLPAPLPSPRRLRRAPRSALRLVSPRAGEVLVGVAVQMPLSALYESLLAVETNPQRRECLGLLIASAKESGR